MRSAALSAPIAYQKRSFIQEESSHGRSFLTFGTSPPSFSSGKGANRDGVSIPLMSAITRPSSSSSCLSVPIIYRRDGRQRNVRVPPLSEPALHACSAPCSGHSGCGTYSPPADLQEGIEPSSTIRFIFASGSGIGIAENRASV